MKWIKAATAIGLSAAVFAAPTLIYNVDVRVEAADSSTSGKCGDNLNWNMEGGRLVISGTGSMYDYSPGQAPWSDIDVTAIDIRQGVTSIGTYAFSRTNITMAVIPEGVKTIGEGAFLRCENLRRAVIPESAETIKPLAFAYDRDLSYVTLPAGVHLEQGAFLETQWLRSQLKADDDGYVSVNNSIVFYNGSSDVVAIPDDEKLNTIDTGLEGYSFAFVNSAKKVLIHDNITGIGYGAFYECKNLETVLIPKSVKIIDGVAFDKCSSLKDVYYTGTQQDWNQMTIVKSDVLESGQTVACNQELVNANIHFNSYYPIFTDVQNQSSPFYNPIYWAADQGITTGIGNNLFAPDNPCTRGQVVTFLWRAAGKPSPKSRNTRLTDLNSSSVFYDAILWAAEQGITTGFSDNTFRQDDTCTRGQIVTFIWRYAGKAKSNAGNSFSDVKQQGNAFYDAILWAVGNKVTTGFDDGTFRQDATCTRGQVVTFLYRHINK